MSKISNEVDNWELKEQFPEKYRKIFPEVNDITLQLLFERGISTSEEADMYLSPEYERDLHDPFLLKDMDKAVSRIIKAINKNEKIILFGDYDADGMGGAAIFLSFFRAIDFDNFQAYIPDRYKEGYGLTKKAIDRFLSEDPSLVITIDCGITNVDEVEYLNSKNINTIIIDHHLVPSKPPNAYAILDHKQDDDKYPYKYLCGAALAFKTIQGILKKESFGLVGGWEKWLLDIIAISTVADMVPLTGENRAIVYFGLKVLAKTKRVGLITLFKKLRLKPADITSNDIAFSIAPHINAASRMGHETTSFDLLVTESVAEAKWMADKIHSTKIEQRGFVDQVIKDTKEVYDNVENLSDVIVFGNMDWRPGVLGIAANRLIDRYSRPIFLWGKGDESEDIKGSSRSNNGLSVVEIMRNVPDGFFIDFGGHHAAAGFSVTPDKADELESTIQKAASKMPRQEIEVKKILIDKELELEAVSRQLYNNIERFEPFGMENPAPIFWFKNLEVKHVGGLGNSGLHTKWYFHGAGNEDLEAIGFWMGERRDFSQIKPGIVVDIAASIEVSKFNGSNKLRLRMVDFNILK